MLKIRRALISVWNKDGLTELANCLARFQVEIISTGKTAAMLRKNGLKVQEVSSLTSFPEILSGRVKTLHPFIFGGILANKKHPLHMEEIKNLGIQPIDMVVTNLYPFEEKLKEQLALDELIEYIDIGGPSLLRAGAKNFKNVACVSSPSQYKAIIEAIEKDKGFLQEDLLQNLAQEVFYLTKEYDKAIYSYLKGKDFMTLDLEKVHGLRYGENPHQKADLYHLVNSGQLKFTQLQGKELSYNNFLDLDTAFITVREFNEPAASIVKHASLCGVGIDKRLSHAYKKAHMTDPISSFGGIIGLNKKVDKDTAKAILKSDFKECVIAPSYSKEALKLFSVKKNMRVIEADFLQKCNYKEIRSTVFGCLLQDRDTLALDNANLKVVTKRKPNPRELKDAIFAWKVAKFVRSNAIVIVRNLAVLSIGGGQPSRVGAARWALQNAIKSCRAAALASDGFFPKEDSIKFAYKKGIKTIIQPGGSIRDKDIINLCNELGISMLFTGTRHFRH